MIIISFANERYKKVALNWAYHMQKLKIKNYIIYSLDEETFRFLKQNDIPTELCKEWSPSEGKYRWQDRLKIISNIIDSGQNVLHSDIDAIWVKNPLKFIDKDYKIVASTGKYPHFISKKIGFTLCMGWIYFESCEEVKGLFSSTLKLFEDPAHEYFEDQKLMNRVIFKNKTKKDVKFLSKGISQIKYKNIKIKVLKEKIISRICNRKPSALSHKQPNVYVQHPLSRKQSDREEIFKKLGLWIIDDK